MVPSRLFSRSRVIKMFTHGRCLGYCIWSISYLVQEAGSPVKQAQNNLLFTYFFVLSIFHLVHFVVAILQEMHKLFDLSYLTLYNQCGEISAVSSVRSRVCVARFMRRDLCGEVSTVKVKAARPVWRCSSRAVKNKCANITPYCLYILSTTV